MSAASSSHSGCCSSRCSSAAAAFVGRDRRGSRSTSEKRSTCDGSIRNGSARRRRDGLGELGQRALEHAGRLEEPPRSGVAAYAAPRTAAGSPRSSHRIGASPSIAEPVEQPCARAGRRRGDRLRGFERESRARAGRAARRRDRPRRRRPRSQPPAGRRVLGAVAAPRPARSCWSRQRRSGGASSVVTSTTSSSAA